MIESKNVPEDCFLAVYISECVSPPLPMCVCIRWQRTHHVALASLALHLISQQYIGVSLEDRTVAGLQTILV